MRKLPRLRLLVALSRQPPRMTRSLEKTTRGEWISLFRKTMVCAVRARAATSPPVLAVGRLPSATYRSRTSEASRRSWYRVLRPGR